MKPWEKNWSEPNTKPAELSASPASKGWEKNPSDDRYSGSIGSFTKMSDNILRLMAEGATMGANKVLSAGTQKVLGATDGSETMEGQRAITDQARNEAGTAGTVAEIAGGIGGALAAPLPAALTSTGARMMTTGGITGALAGAAQSYFDTGDISLPQVAVGGLLGVGGGALGAGLSKLTYRPPMSAAATAAERRLSDAGIDMTVGQMLRDPKVLAKEAVEPNAMETIAKQVKNFSTAMARKAGIVADPETGAISRATMEAALRATGFEMDELTKRARFDVSLNSPVGMKLVDDMRSTLTTYLDNVEGGSAKIIKNTFKQVLEGLQKGGLDGAKFQEITSALGDTARGSTGNLANAANDMRRAITGAMEDHLTEIGSPLAGAWGAANRKYSNQLVIQNALAQRTDEAAEGILSPKMMRAATQSVQGKSRWATGKTDFDELVNDAITYMKPLPTAKHGDMHSMTKAVTTLARMTGAGGLAAASSAMGQSPALGAAMLFAPEAINSVAALGREASPMVGPFGRAMTGAAVGGLSNVAGSNNNNGGNPFQK